MVGFMTFMRNAQKAQGSLAKSGEASSIDMAIRALLSNNLACLSSAQTVSFDPAQTNVEQVAKLRDSNGVVIFSQGQQSNGVQITKLTATVGPRAQNVHLIHYNVVVKKLGPDVPVGGRSEYAHTYLTNVTINPATNAAARCFSSGGPDGTFQLLGVENLGLAFGPGNNQCSTVNNGCPLSTYIAPHYLVWGPAQAPALCDGKPASCAHNVTQVTPTITARGNVMTVLFRADLTVGTGSAAGCPPTSGVFNSSITGLIWDSAGTLLAEPLIASMQLNAAGASELQRSIGLSSELLYFDTQTNANYRLGLRHFISPPSLNERSIGIACGAYAQVHHYLKTNAP